MKTGFGGSEIKTADGVVGISGKPYRLYSVTWLSGGTAGNLVLRNGTADTADVFLTISGTISRSVTQNFEGGLLFPAGCFYDHDANTTRAVMNGENEA